VGALDVQLTISAATDSVIVAADRGGFCKPIRPDIDHGDHVRQKSRVCLYNGSEGRNFQALLLLQPGAAPRGHGRGQFRRRQPATRRSRCPRTAFRPKPITPAWMARSTPILGCRSTVAYVPSPEAIETVSVSTNAFDAEQGSAGGAAINVTIKSGTNDLHGVLFERNTNQDLDAVNNYFSHPGRLAKNIQNQYGFAVGGPVWIPQFIHGRNKFFWFMDYETHPRRVSMRPM